MNVTVIAVGGLKERYWRDAVSEYGKRLSAYCRLELVEVKDEKTPDKAPASLACQIKEKEGKRILLRLRDRSFCVALDLRGEHLSSEAFSAAHASWEQIGGSDISFIIGGSLGLSPAVLSRADYRLSFSDMTFPHQLMRVILLEQLYRSYRIRTHAPYHK
jgi:hypothetical protein